MQAEAESRGMSLYQIITLASIIEKESGQAQENQLLPAFFITV